MATSVNEPLQMVSEQMAGLTIDNQPDPYISNTSQSPHPYQEPWQLHQELPIPIQEEINHKNATFERTYRVLKAMAHKQLRINTAKDQHLHPCPKPRITKTARTASSQPKSVPSVSRTATKTSFPQPRNVLCFMNPPLHSQEHRQVPINHQEPSQVPTRNSKNKLSKSKTAPNTTLNIPQTEDFESSTWMIYELEHSVEVLESMELSTTIMFIQSINKNIAAVINSLQDRLLAARLSMLEKERLANLPHKIWGTCLELTKQYPTGYDSELNDFGFFAIMLDELIKNYCIDVTKGVHSDSSSCKNDEAQQIFDDGDVKERSVEDSLENVKTPSVIERFRDLSNINKKNQLRADANLYVENSKPINGSDHEEEASNRLAFDHLFSCCQSLYCYSFSSLSTFLYSS